MFKKRLPRRREKRRLSRTRATSLQSKRGEIADAEVAESTAEDDVKAAQNVLKKTTSTLEIARGEEADETESLTHAKKMRQKQVDFSILPIRQTMKIDLTSKSIRRLCYRRYWCDWCCRRRENCYGSG